MIVWTRKRPSQAGFYYWQNQELLNYNRDAVLVVQIDAHTDPTLFTAKAMTYKGALFKHLEFSCNVKDVPGGWWAGPLPSPRHY